ncbi:MAG: GNAT family N-acetyltransferase [Proteobacteria bacterium]|nr:GNAT family N-acetyltransferase [Pseudomonadota bacterium]
MPAENRIMRVLKRDDLKAVIAIDALVSKQQRDEYYERKFDSILNTTHNINSSIVCEIAGRVVGFIMGDVYFGEFGIPETNATIDTIGVHPEFANRGVASEMLDQFMMNMKAARVGKVYTLVNWDDFALEKFFAHHKFAPSKRVNLECTVI